MERVDIIQDIEGFRKLKEIWNCLAENSQKTTQFYDFVWNMIW